MRKFAIFGAGISGLSLAWYLKKKLPDCHVTLIEKSDRVGGCIKSIVKDGFLFELGPHSFRTSQNGLYTLELIKDLKLEDELITPDSSAKKRYLLINDQLRQISFFKQPFFSIFLKAFFKNLISSKSDEDESIYNFTLRQFGKEAFDYFIDPLTLGIFAGDAKKLSAKACLPAMQSSFFKMFFRKKNHKHPLLSFKNGMETLPQTLYKQLQAKVIFSTEAKKITFNPNTVDILLTTEELLKVDHLFSTLSWQDLNTLLNLEQHEEEKASIAVVNLGYSSRVLNDSGFGYLIPTTQNKQALGVIWDSSVFKQQNKKEQTRLTVMLREKEGCDYLKAALDTVKKDLNIKILPQASHVHFWSHAIPQYQVNHLNKIATLKNKLPSSITFLGNSFYGVSINDCIAQAKLTVDTL